MGKPAFYGLKPPRIHPLHSAAVARRFGVRSLSYHRKPLSSAISSPRNANVSLWPTRKWLVGATVSLLVGYKLLHLWLYRRFEESNAALAELAESIQQEGRQADKDIYSRTMTKRSEHLQAEHEVPAQNAQHSTQALTRWNEAGGGFDRSDSAKSKSNAGGLSAACTLESDIPHDEPYLKDFVPARRVLGRFHAGVAAAAGKSVGDQESRSDQGANDDGGSFRQACTTGAAGIAESSVQACPHTTDYPGEVDRQCHRSRGMRLEELHGSVLVMMYASISDIPASAQKSGETQGAMNDDGMHVPPCHTHAGFHWHHTPSLYCHRMEDLSLQAKHELLEQAVASGNGGIRSVYGEMVAELLMHTYGAELTALKRMLDRGADYSDLRQLVFGVVPLAHRADVLRHLEWEAEKHRSRRRPVSDLAVYCVETVGSELEVHQLRVSSLAVLAVPVHARMHPDQSSERH